MKAEKLTYIDWWKKGAEINPSSVATPEPTVEQTQAPVAPSQYSQPTQGVPYIQPLVVVPYVSNEQPMYYYDASALQQGKEGSEEYYEDMFDTEESSALDEPKQRRMREQPIEYYDVPAQPEPSVTKTRKANVFAILSFLFCGIYIALLFNLTSLMESFTYNFLYGGNAAFDIIKAFVEGIIANGFAFDVNTTLVPMLVSAGAVFMAITAICSIVTVASRTPIVIKIIAALAFLLNVGAAVVAKFIVKMDITTYGLYILAGVSFVVFLFTMIARNKKNK